MSLYLQDSVGVEANMDTLHELAALLKAIDGPWIVAGDFNLSPEALAESNWHRIVGGTIMAPKQATCNSSTYDYFVVKNSLASRVAAVQVLKDGGLTPHSPCRLYLRAAGDRKALRRLRKPMKIPGTLQHGPSLAPPDYETVHQSCRQGCINAAMEQWYTLARREFANITGLHDEARSPKFVWDAHARSGACDGCGSTTPAVAWRVVAATAEELARRFDGRGDSRPESNRQACDEDQRAASGVTPRATR